MGALTLSPRHGYNLSGVPVRNMLCKTQKGRCLWANMARFGHIYKKAAASSWRLPLKKQRSLQAYRLTVPLCRTKEADRPGLSGEKISLKASAVLFEKILIYKNINRAAYRNNKAWHPLRKAFYPIAVKIADINGSSPESRPYGRFSGLLFGTTAYIPLRKPLC